MPARSVGYSRRSVGLALVAGLSALAGRASAEEPFRIGTEGNDAPFSLIDGDETTGFSIDIGNEICRRLHLRCVWVGMTFDTLIPSVMAGRIDAAISQITVTPARAAQVLFTRPVTATGGLLVVPDLSDITNDPSTMKGKTIGVQTGTTHEAYAERAIAPVARLRHFPTQAEAFAALLSGHIDATLCDMELGHKWLEAHSGDFRFADRPIVDPSHYGSDTAIALRLGLDGLRARFDQAIGAMLRDGTFAEINKRYFTFSIAPDTFGNPL